jgi:hypothetical protein
MCWYGNGIDGKDRCNGDLYGVGALLGRVVRKASKFEKRDEFPIPNCER